MAKKLPQAKAIAKPVVIADEASRGRPPGAENIRTETVVDVSCCPQCQSTEREEYTNKTELAMPGLYKERPYTHIVWRSTRCLTCGQTRRDRSYENRPEHAG